MIRLIISKFCRNCRFMNSPGGKVPKCLAFPKGIPAEIFTGKNNHSKPLPKQDNGIVFEPIKAEKAK